MIKFKGLDVLNLFFRYKFNISSYIVIELLTIVYDTRESQLEINTRSLFSLLINERRKKVTCEKLEIFWFKII